MNRMISMLMRIFISQVMRQGIRRGMRGMGGGGRRAAPRQQPRPTRERLDARSGPGPDNGPGGSHGG